MSIHDDLLQLRELKQERDKAKQHYDSCDRDFREAQAALWEKMAEEKVDSLKVDGTNFVRSSTAYATVQDREEFREWAKQNDESLVELKERAALLNQLVRERLDNGEELPPGVGMYTREIISQRSAD